MKIYNQAALALCTCADRASSTTRARTQIIVSLGRVRMEIRLHSGAIQDFLTFLAHQRQTAGTSECLIRVIGKLSVAAEFRAANTTLHFCTGLLGVH